MPAPFKYFIVDLDCGEVEGTNDEGIAHSLAESEDYFIIEKETNQWLQPNGGEVKGFDIKEFRAAEEANLEDFG